MKAKFTTDKFDASVSVEFDAESPDFDNYETIRKTRTFSCPRDGGYVIEHIGRGNTAQVCERLSSVSEQQREEYVRRGASQALREWLDGKLAATDKTNN